MIFIDATKGLSGDMLLAAMIGLLDGADRAQFSKCLEDAAAEHAFVCRVVDIEEQGQRGVGLSCTQAEPVVHGVTYDECFLGLEDMERHLGGDGGIGRRILELIFEAEGKAHSLPPREVHLHEIGRPQALLNIAGIGMLAAKLGRAWGDFSASTIITGRGIVVMSHGAVRVPPPVSDILLKDMMHAPGDAPGERATPTGIAAVKILANAQTDDAPTSFRRRSIGWGSKRFAGELGRTSLVVP